MLRPTAQPSCYANGHGEMRAYNSTRAASDSACQVAQTRLSRRRELRSWREWMLTTSRIPIDFDGSLILSRAVLTSPLLEAYATESMRAGEWCVLATAGGWCVAPPTSRFRTARQCFGVKRLMRSVGTTKKPAERKIKTCSRE